MVFRHHIDMQEDCSWFKKLRQAERVLGVLFGVKFSGQVYGRVMRGYAALVLSLRFLLLLYAEFWMSVFSSVESLLAFDMLFFLCVTFYVLLSMCCCLGFSEVNCFWLQPLGLCGIM